MFFSVLVPVYNAARYLRECVESVLRQTEQDFELVLVDDGSSDGSGALCDDFCGRYPEKIRVLHQQNRGLILARRAGIALARGAYCLFLDADDAFEPNCLAVVRETIKRLDADIVLFTYTNCYESEGTQLVDEMVFADNTLFTGEGKRALYEELISSWRLNNLCMKAIATPLVQEDDTPYERFAGNAHGEDLLQSLYPLTNAGRVVYRARALYRYRHHDESITSRLMPGRIERHLNSPVLDQLRSYMTIWGLDTPRMIERFHVRNLTKLITTFWQHYRAARSDIERRAVLDEPWSACVGDEARAYIKSRMLPWPKRVQLAALLRKDKRMLDVIERLGRVRVRASYGK